jgi:hypothetical protein
VQDANGILHRLLRETIEPSTEYTMDWWTRTLRSSLGVMLQASLVGRRHMFLLEIFPLSKRGRVEVACVIWLARKVSKRLFGRGVQITLLLGCPKLSRNSRLYIHPNDNTQLTERLS